MLRELLKDKRLLIFAACVVLFHLSNAAMLNLAAGEVTAHMGDNVQLVIAACIIVPQFIVAALSPWVGRQAQKWGRRPVLILGFCALPVRALLFAGVSSPYLLVPVQMLDGISAAVFGVMLPLIAADVAGGRGHYNLTIGFFGLAAGVGATLSTAAAGFAADRFGTAMSFFGLAAAGAIAVALVWLAMPETRGRRWRPRTCRSRRWRLEAWSGRSSLYGASAFRLQETRDAAVGLRRSGNVGTSSPAVSSLCIALCMRCRAFTMPSRRASETRRARLCRLLNVAAQRPHRVAHPRFDAHRVAGSVGVLAFIMPSPSTHNSGALRCASGFGRRMTLASTCSLSVDLHGAR